MKIVEAESTYLSTEGLTPYQFMEKAGRTCYKSLNNITDDSAVKFVQGLKKSGHTAMLEHAHIIFMITRKVAEEFINDIHKNDYSVCGSKVRVANYLNISDCDTYYIISGSFRAFIALFENDFDKNGSISTKLVMKQLHNKYPEIFDDIIVDSKFEASSSIFELTRDKFIDFARANFSDLDMANNLIRRHLTHTMLFLTDRGVTHEYVRHRPVSFAQESTRYCNYSKDKFGNEITVVRPVFFEEGTEIYDIWKEGCEHDEEVYFKLLNLNCKAQEARDNLPTSVKTELIVTCTEEEWQHIINLRKHGTTGSPHPQMVQSMDLGYEELIKHANNRIS